MRRVTKLVIERLGAVLAYARLSCPDTEAAETFKYRIFVLGCWMSLLQFADLGEKISAPTVRNKERCHMIEFIEILPGLAIVW